MDEDHEARNRRLYEEQMAEVPIVEGIIEGLRAELNECPATVRGYREAAGLRDSIAMWSGMRERMLAFAATVTAVNAPPL